MESFVQLRKGRTPRRPSLCTTNANSSSGRPTARSRWVDPVDPNERTPGTCCLGDPQVVNMSPVGLARFCSLRSWLSQWSYDDANGDGVSQRETLRQAVGICTDWLIRHNSASLQ